LTSRAASLDEVDLAGADRLIAERLETIRGHQIVDLIRKGELGLETISWSL